jgi:hypothetical protein
MKQRVNWTVQSVLWEGVQTSMKFFWLKIRILPHSKHRTSPLQRPRDIKHNCYVWERKEENPLLASTDFKDLNHWPAMGRSRRRNICSSAEKTFQVVFLLWTQWGRSLCLFGLKCHHTCLSYLTSLKETFDTQTTKVTYMKALISFTFRIKLRCGRKTMTSLHIQINSGFLKISLMTR